MRMIINTLPCICIKYLITLLVDIIEYYIIIALKYLLNCKLSCNFFTFF